VRVTTFYLVRHGANDWIGNAIAGRTPGVCLNATGREQTQRIADRLANEGIQRIICSPMERCRETAAPLAKRIKVQVEISEAVNEVNFGDWNGKTLKQLESVPDWKKWNSTRSAFRIPNGENIGEIQARMVQEVLRLRRETPEQKIAIFSHGDPLRSVICYFLGTSLDLMARVEINPGSISMVNLFENDVRINLLNLIP
jgi:broad specificity phosphatase PhoE